MNRKYRLTKNRSFEYVYRKGTGVGSKELTVITVPSRFGLKVGFSVGKKVGGAVCRNKVKRRLKECFRALIPVVAHPNTYVIVAKAPVKEISFSAMGAVMRRLLVKAGKIAK